MTENLVREQPVFLASPCCRMQRLGVLVTIYCTLVDAPKGIQSSLEVLIQHIDPNVNVLPALHVQMIHQLLRQC